MNHIRYLNEYDFDLFTLDSSDDYPKYADGIEINSERENKAINLESGIASRLYSTPADKTNAEVAQSDRASAF